MIINPPSDRDVYAEFEAFYASNIEPFLLQKESRRRQAVTLSLAITACTGAATAATYALAPFGAANLQVAFLVLIIGLSIVGGIIAKARSAISAGLLERIVSYFGFSYTHAPGRASFAGDLDRLGLLPSYNRQSWEDEVRGERHGADFILCEALLKKRTGGRKKRIKTVFHGQLLVIDYHKEFIGETIIKRDAGILNRFAKPGDEYHRIGLVSAEFERAFEAWSTDQVEARELLDPVVLERFLELERLFGGAKLRAAFSRGKLYVVLETGDRLNMGTLFKPLNDPARIETILKEFDVIFDLIDVAVKRFDTQLQGRVRVANFR